MYIHPSACTVWSCVECVGGAVSAGATPAAVVAAAVSLSLRDATSDMNVTALILSSIFVALLLALGVVVCWMGRVFRVQRYHVGNLRELTPYLSSLRQPFIPIGTPHRGGTPQRGHASSMGSNL